MPAPSFSLSFPTSPSSNYPSVFLTPIGRIGPVERKEIKKFLWA